MCNNKEISSIIKYPEQMEFYKDPETGKSVLMIPGEDAINLYLCIEEAIGKIDLESLSDYKCFGDKAISFERLYDVLEDEILEYRKTHKEED